MKKWSTLCFSNIGPGKENQDSFNICEFRKKERIIYTLLVCDGMGGHVDGKQCSSVICEKISEKVTAYLRKKIRKRPINETNIASIQKILGSLSVKDGNPLSRTTMTLLVFDTKRTKKGYCCLSFWAGDSRIYAIESTGKAEQVSEDQKNKEGHIVTFYSGDGTLSGSLGSKCSYMKDPIAILNTSDGLNCQLNGLYKFILAFLFDGICTNEGFEQETLSFLGDLLRDNTTALLLFRNYPKSIFEKAYYRIK
jgi:hypothetical protein